jgi:hypothetical protein
MGIISNATHSPSEATSSVRRLRMISKAWDATVWIQHDANHWEQ